MPNTIVTVQNTISAYLYGTLTPPVDLTARVRDGDLTNPHFTLDVAAYMGSVGRFTNVFQTTVVQHFFAGMLDISGYAPGSDGVIRVSLDQLISDTYQGEAATRAQRVVLSNYTTGIAETDFVMRAFVFGTSGFTLSSSTVFILENGIRSIENAVLLPNSENFDFETSNPAVQLVNDNLLRPVIDPYNIGRQFFLDFAPTDVASWACANASGRLYESDAPGVVADVYDSYEAAILGPIAVTAYAAAVANLTAEILSSVEYSRDDKNIIYGNNDNNVVDAAYPNVLYYDDDNPSHYITGGGEDEITTLGSQGDEVHSGSGKDKIDTTATQGATAHGGDDNDLIIVGDFSDAYGDAGNDRLILGNGSNGHGGEGADNIFVEGGFYHTVEAGVGDDNVIFSRDPSGFDEKSTTVTLGAGADTVYIDADNSSSYWTGSGNISILDSEVEDRIFFNGYELDGGVFSVFKEVTNTEVFDGAAGYLDQLGVIYGWDDASDTLSIRLPDMTNVTISDWQNGDFGIVLNASANYFNDGSASLEQNGWTNLPRAPSATARGWFGTGDYPWGEVTHNNLPSALHAYQFVGSEVTPILPTFSHPDL